MEKCKCWEETKRIVGWYRDEPIHKTVQICNGTKEREECSCNGDKSKCNFYPKNRKESKTMNTAEMWIKAQEDGKTYYRGDVEYQKDTGLVEIGTQEVWPLDAWSSLNNLMEEEWEQYQTMTKSEAEAKFNIKIVGD